MLIQNSEWIKTVLDIIKRGNAAEVKREKDNIVVVEIKQQVKIKTAIKGEEEQLTKVIQPLFL